MRQCPFTAVDCVVSNWGPFSPCIGTCGSSVKTRTRTILVHWAQGGLMCPSLHDSSPCKHSKPCPIDCTVTEWSPYEATCSVTCGSGVLRRFRSIKHPAADGGRECPPLISTKLCTVPTTCPKDCIVTQWSADSPCSTTCGAGSTSRTRSITQYQDPEGKK